MLEFNVGELATRLRTALGVRGRIPLGLDEHVIPTSIVADVTVAPWRTNPVFSQGAVYCEVATPGDYAVVTLAFLPGTIQTKASVFVLTGWTLQPLSFVTATGIAVANNAALARWNPTGAIAGAPTAPSELISTERRNVPPGPSLVPWELPLVLYPSGTALPAAINDPGQLQYTKAGSVQPPIFMPTEVLIRPGQSINFYSTHAATATETSALAVEVQGLYYGLGS